MSFPRQGCLSGLPFPSPGDLLDLGIEPSSLALAGRFFTTESLGKHSQAWLPAGFSRIPLYSLEQEGLLQTDPRLAPVIFTKRPLDHKEAIGPQAYDPTSSPKLVVRTFAASALHLDYLGLCYGLNCVP